VSSIPRPVCIATAGGNDYRISVNIREHPIGGLGHTVPKSWPRAAVAEIFERTDTTFLSDPISLLLSRNSLRARACSWRRAVTDSADWQVWSRSASEWSANVIPVCLS
jgi:hypothetical protein